MIGSRTSPPLDVGVVGAGLAEGLALGLAGGDALGGAVDGAAVGDSAGELDALALGEGAALAAFDGERPGHPLDIAVLGGDRGRLDRERPSVNGVSGRATMRRWLSGSMPPVATVEPVASLITRRLFPPRSCE